VDSHIRIDNLTVSYGSNVIINGLTLGIPNNQIVVIIGPSGCGKTTLLKCMNRLIDLHADVEITGRIGVDGMEVYDPDVDILLLRKKVGFIPQRAYPLPMSIYDNVAFGPRIHRFTPEQILHQIKEHEKYHPMLPTFEKGVESLLSSKKSAVVDFFVEYYLKIACLWDEVKNRLNEPASSLSIGQQQRLALARTLSVEPEIILADEPTSSLDPVSAKFIEDRFRLLKQNYSIILVTHILRQAARIADYVVFLYMGQLVEHGPAKTFFESPKNEKTRAYISGEFS
jgi:phosphate transport system ATP-binding protein